MVTQENKELMDNIMSAERTGYAYVYSLQGDREEFLLSLEPENLADFIGTHGLHADKIVITDAMDCLVADTCGWFLNTCPEQKMLTELLPLLIPIQTFEKEPGPVLAIDIKTAEECAMEREKAVKERILTM